MVAADDVMVPSTGGPPPTVATLADLPTPLSDEPSPGVSESVAQDDPDERPVQVVNAELASLDEPSGAGSSSNKSGGGATGWWWLAGLAVVAACRRVGGLHRSAMR